MKTKRERNLEYIRELWQSPGEKYGDYEYIAKYHNLKAGKSNLNTVDPGTWTNLNMDELFEKMDHNISCFGQQFLFHTLCTYKEDKRLLKRYGKKYDIFIKDDALRENLQYALINLQNSNSNSYYLVNLLFGKLPEKPSHYFIFYILSFITFFSLPAMAFNLVFIFPLLIFGLTNIFINGHYSKTIFSHFSVLSSLNSLLESAIKLSKCKTDTEIEQLIVLKKEAKAAALIKKSIGWLIKDKTKLNDFSVALVEFLNQILLFELLTFLSSLNKLKKYRNELIEIFEAVASLDSEIAISAYLNNREFYCLPVFNDKRSFDFSSIYHPLIEDAVSNDFRINDKSVLITGSNMAGKTTFIKTIGVNLILAKTAGFVLAKSAQVPDLQVYASIKISDDIIKGQSYYFASVEEILKFINKSKESSKYLFLIDEIFKGTNTLERISASKAVLNYLSKNAVTMVTTHDLELEDLLKENYEMYNFSEQFKDSRVYFDYKIIKGKCTGRNAIKLLEISGYPEEIIKEALEEFDKYSKKVFVN